MKSRDGNDGNAARSSVACSVVKGQWQMGEVNVDGWGGGPLSQAQNAA